ncbi:hypothetical protein [Clostridium sp. ZS2-4]|uniref:hypothetical protein n=1 Tax=Clostridium sp. ZS2-4 TaxID=2987703 RepID=UPI00227CCE5F|nr:hypothetical protein [Clostridium sp. ZS2-4]MCY6355305.1 hypothetical protein [Clostridium sp. ZS2-4]
MKKVKLTILAVALSMSIPVLAHALDLEGGALRYEGGQTKKSVYSKIYDAKTSFRNTKGDGKSWGCKATVKVGTTTYTSGWHYGTASISADRHWYSNETSYYDYEQLTIKEYTNQNWGALYSN